MGPELGGLSPFRLAGNVRINCGVILLICQIFSEVTELQEKARKEGILKSDENDQRKTSEADNNLLVRNLPHKLL